MITKLDFGKNGQFEITGSIDLKNIDLDSKKIDTKSFFSLLIKLLLDLKTCTAAQLADDNKILYDERIEVVKAIDKFLTGIFAFALINSTRPLYYYSKYKDLIEITLEATRMKYLKGSGKLQENLPAINDYEEWIELKLIDGLKKIIAEFDEEGNMKIINEEIIKIIFNSLVFRYKIEYVR